MEQLILFLYRKRKALIGPLVVGMVVVTALWWFPKKKEINELQWQYVQPFGIRVPLKYTVHGIDVSHHNHRIDWKRVCQMQAGGLALQFVFVKATEGATLVDRRFQSNWREARKAGLRRGAYHFYLPRRDPVKQARNFINTVTLESGDFAPVLDFETDAAGKIPSDRLIADLRLWLSMLEAHYGIKPIIYTNRHFYLLYIEGNFDDYPLWIADYTTEHPKAFQSDRLYLWQHNKGGWVDGIRGHVDFNVFVHEPERINEICVN
ncbi:glycoside hydrolase family 25 protein [Larkinella soli]|uniref:glycoside hydrolase family 25 protein n=1 Tax=Larkinella soli TaxID=1770527 RepID=UPI001E345753|nr:GH25 family lysozyme [Larkinella soli]